MVADKININRAYHILRKGIVSYKGQLSPQEQKWLRDAITEAAQALPPPSTSDRLFSDPIKVTQALIDEKQGIPIIIASLIYGRIKKDQLSDHAYQKKLAEVSFRYDGTIQNLVRFALQDAYTDMPFRTPKLEQDIAQSEWQRKAHFANVREERKRNPAVKVMPIQTLEEQQSTDFIAYADSINPVPISQVIRLADRWVSLKDIDPDTATPQQKARIKESWLIHAQMANNHGLRRFYYNFGNLYVRTFFPESYKAIEQSLDLLAKAVSADGNPLDEITQFLGKQLGLAGLEPKDDPDNMDGGYCIKLRLKKSVISIWTKLIADGIDPEDYFKKYAEQIKSDPSARLKILINDVFKDELFDLFAFTVIVDEQKLVELELIEAGDPHKPWHVHKNACTWVDELLQQGVQRGGPLRAQHYIPLKHRTKDYFVRPRGQREYRSRHVGQAKVVSIPELGINRLRVPIEGIIRTPLVHFHAEHGKWAHSRFKSELIRGAASWQDAQREVDARHDVFLFSPDGEIMRFKKGTTIRDVAFSISQDLGLYCTGATVFGGYRSWRQQDVPDLRELDKPLTPDTVLDESFNGCSIIVAAKVPEAVTEMRSRNVMGYLEMPPGYDPESLAAVYGRLNTSVARSKMRRIVRRFPLTNPAPKI
jgi:TGS domain